MCDETNQLLKWVATSQSFHNFLTEWNSSPQKRLLTHGELISIENLICDACLLLKHGQLNSHLFQIFEKTFYEICQKIHRINIIAGKIE
jgi:hypothetical protein